MPGRSSHATYQRILPLGFFLVCVVTIGTLWNEHKNDEEQRLVMETDITAEQVGLRLESWVDTRIAVLRSMALDVARHELGDEAAFVREAQSIIDLYPGFLAVNHINADGVIDIVVPMKPNRAAKQKSLLEHPAPDVRETFRRSRETGVLTRTSTIMLLQGFTGLATYIPITIDARVAPIGFINGVFRDDELVDSCLSESSLRERFLFVLSEADGTVAYASEPDIDFACSHYCIHRDLAIVDRPWTLHLAPKPGRYAAGTSPADDILSICGLIMSMILALLIRTVLIRHEELTRSKADYKLLIDNIKDLVIKIDADRRVVFVSPSFCSTFGIDTDKVSNRRLLTMLPASERVAVMNAIDEATSSGGVSTYEQWLPTTDGPKWIAWNIGNVFDDNGMVEASVLVGRDITARRELEEQLIQSQKMQAVGELAGGIAHDFNNILQSITGSLELAMLDTDSDAQPYRDMAQARKSTSRAASLTKQLLAFSRRQVLEPEDIDLNAVVMEMHDLLQRSVGRNVEIAYDLSGKDATIHADMTQIQQILLNLCVNARDAMDEGGNIGIVVRHTRLDQAFCRDKAWARPGRFVLLEVTDDGCGMDAETIENIFEPFFTTKRQSGGTGLGLSTVHGIVSQHGGLLDVDSSIGEGTTFRLYFEYTGRIATSAEPLASPQVIGGNETILLAEDDEAVRRLSTRILEASGYEVLATSNGREALSVYHDRREDIDMIILDVVMPDMGGREVHDAVRESDPDLPTLFCSGFDSEAIHSRYVLDEGLVLLPKPFESEQLLLRVRELLEAVPVKA